MNFSHTLKPSMLLYNALSATVMQCWRYLNANLCTGSNRTNTLGTIFSIAFYISVFEAMFTLIC